MPDTQDRVQRTINRLVESGAERGIQVAAYRSRDQIVDAVAGIADPATGRAVTADTPFYNFSIGKGVTATIAPARRARSVRVPNTGGRAVARIRRPRQGFGDCVACPQPHRRCSRPSARQHGRGCLRLGSHLLGDRRRRALVGTRQQDGLPRLQFRLHRRRDRPPRDRAADLPGSAGRRGEAARGR